MVYLNHTTLRICISTEESATEACLAPLESSTASLYRHRVKFRQYNLFCSVMPCLLTLLSFMQVAMLPGSPFMCLTEEANP